MSTLKRRLTFSNVVSVIALFVALGGGAYAAVKLKPNSVKSKHIAPDAVQGIDANESSFGPVPRATNADSATTAGSAATADNAATLNGLSSDAFQFGNGVDNAIAGIADSGNTGAISVFEGVIGIACSATPQLVYQDTGGDPLDTHVWTDGTHQTVADGGFATLGTLTAAGDSAQVQIWGGGGTVAHVVASVLWDGGATACTEAFSTQENLDTGGSAAAAAAQTREARPRGKLPEGWVTPRRNP
jgi:hypothetical protein